MHRRLPLSQHLKAALARLDFGKEYIFPEIILHRSLRKRDED
jgi:hypothetical protein